MAITKVSANLVDLDGGIVINESSADVDFRVESNGNANMLFVDGGNDRVGIGTASPNYKLEINHTGADTNALVLNDEDTVSNATGLYLRSTSEGRISFGSGAALTFAGAGGGSERMRIDSTGNVGIGTTSPSAELSVSNSGVEGYEISPATVIGGTIRQLAFNRSTSAYIPMRVQASEHQFYASGSEAMRIQSGGGISFNGDTAAANALDDYEEGTFSGTTTGSVYSGTYTKIGRICHVSFEVDNSSSTGTSIAVMPFSAKAGTAVNGAQPTKNTSNTNNNVYVAIYNGGSTVYIYSSTGTTQSVTTGSISVNFVYETD